MATAVGACDGFRPKILNMAAKARQSRQKIMAAQAKRTIRRFLMIRIIVSISFSFANAQLYNREILTIVSHYDTINS